MNDIALPRLRVKRKRPVDPFRGALESIMLGDGVVVVICMIWGWYAAGACCAGSFSCTWYAWRAYVEGGLSGRVVDWLIASTALNLVALVIFFLRLV